MHGRAANGGGRVDTELPCTIMHSIPVTDLRALGEALRRARRRQGLRQDEVALAAGVSTRSVHAIEHGKETAQAVKILRVIDALGFTLALVAPDAPGED